MIAFFSVLYHPTDNAITNILSAKENGYITVVYLNSVSNDIYTLLEENDVIMLGSNRNDGLGKAFYTAERYFKEESIDYFIYFDQDTIVEEHVWNKIKEEYEEFFLNSDTGLIFYGKAKENPLLVVSSGSLFSMKILELIGYHDDSYFVECVDYELCLRLKNNGYSIYVVSCDGIDHFSLQDNQTKTIFGYDFTIRSYGNERFKDLVKSHLRLIIKSIKLLEFKMFYLYLKSLSIFLLGEVKSRFLITFS